jgi:sterol desaturase/sphingolipid hydroxylase (fatty acid hydroxylase superfamily)
MPTPIDILLDPVSITALAIYASLMCWEWLAPGRALPTVRHWKLKGLAAFTVFFFLSSYLPLVWDQNLAQYQLLDLTGLGTAGSAALGLLVYEFCAYWWHRWMHSSDLLWRGLHQMHHSAERLDTFGAFWFSPLDMIGWTAVGSLSLVLVVGVTPQAATLLLLGITFLAIFQHANSGRRVTPFITGRTSTVTTTQTCQCSTCCSEPSGTPAASRSRPASTRVHPTGLRTCSCSGT